MFWTDTLEQALRCYEALWTRASGRDGISTWADEPHVPTFLPYDHGDVLAGADSIALHLEARLASTELERVHWTPLASWETVDGHYSIVDQRLSTLDRLSGRAEARRHHVVLVTVGAGDALRLRHLSEAPPAVLTTLIQSYERHAASAAEL
jgi:hypothetical protein